jgi:hypothetical protein
MLAGRLATDFDSWYERQCGDGAAGAPGEERDAAAALVALVGAMSIYGVGRNEQSA